MQITPGMRVSDVCMFCFEHTIDQPCPEEEALSLREEAEYQEDLAREAEEENMRLLQEEADYWDAVDALREALDR